MEVSYMIKIDEHYKIWIAKKSVIDSIPIYTVFQETLYPYFLKNSKEKSIKKIVLTNKTKPLALSRDFGKTLRLEAIERNTNVVSLVNAVFQFYLENNPDSRRVLFFGST